jgi:hypothetical protein
MILRFTKPQLHSSVITENWREEEEEEERGLKIKRYLSYAPQT